MKEALFYEKLKNKIVQCHLCNHNCVIPEGKRGICKVRENIKGKLYSLVYAKACSSHADPIEKKPLFHFHPGSKCFSIATVGCNFRCLHCQNWEISQSKEILGEEFPPEKVIELAQRTGCQGIAYTYTEPTIFYEYALDTMKLAKKVGLYNVWVSNGYICEEPLRKIARFLDGINIDLKSSSDKFYREVCSAKIQPVLNNIALCRKLGVWTEIAALIIPGYNDSEKALKELSQQIFSIDPEIPLHISAYYPSYKMTAPPTPTSTIERSVKIAKKVGLKYVYVGNVPGSEHENTFCPHCKRKILGRGGFAVTETNMIRGRCIFCKEKISGIF